MFVDEIGSNAAGKARNCIAFRKSGALSPASSMICCIRQGSDLADDRSASRRPRHSRTNVAAQIRCSHRRPLYPCPPLNPARSVGRSRQPLIHSGTDATGSLILSTRVRCSRRVAGAALKTGCSRRKTSSAASSTTSRGAPASWCSSLSHCPASVPRMGLSSILRRSSSAASAVQMTAVGSMTERPSPSMCTNISATSRPIAMS